MAQLNGPRKIQKLPTHLHLEWADGRTSNLSYSEIRRLCSCAVCRETGGRNLASASPSGTLPRQLELVGNYALGILWGDGHRSILAFDRLIQAQPSASESSFNTKLDLS